jgi:hypothetical protein
VATEVTEDVFAGRDVSAASAAVITGVGLDLGDQFDSA